MSIPYPLLWSMVEFAFTLLTDTVRLCSFQLLPGNSVPRTDQQHNCWSLVLGVKKGKGKGMVLDIAPLNDAQ